MSWKSNEFAEEAYFMWLCSLVHADGPDQSYFGLMNILHGIDFVSRVPHDENREADGVNLRYLFEKQCKEEYPYPRKCCTLLEMMVALSRRIEDDVMYDPAYGDRSADWFWEMIENLELDQYDDSYDLYGGYVEYGDGQWSFVDKIKDVCYTLVDREYDYDGSGGLFPLENPNKDQRNVEIWYQMSAYFLENYDV